MCSEENPQKLLIRAVSGSWNGTKWGTLTDRDQNLINTEGGKDTSTCQISAHPSHMFSMQCPETANITLFIKSKYHQNKGNQQTVAKKGISSTSGKDTQACQILGHSSNAF